MRGWIHGGVACALAIAVMGRATVAGAQQYDSPMASADQHAAPAPQGAVQATPASAGAEMANDDLAARVANLERALADAKCKEDAAKAKAACAPSAQVGGMIQLDDAAFGNENAATRAAVNSGSLKPFNNGEEFRRARIWVTGDMFDNMDYKIEMDFASTSRPKFKDVYADLLYLPYVGNFRIGHFKEPYSLEELTSDRFITFMERNMVCDANSIVPERNIGVEFWGYNECQTATYQIGCFLNEDSVEDPPEWPLNANNNPTTPTGFADINPQQAMTMRATYLPWYDEATQGRGLWHTGVAYSYRNDTGIQNTTTGQTILFPNYGIKPEAHLAPNVVSLNNFPAVDNQLLGIEQAFVYGPLSVQAEYYADYVNEGGRLQNATFTAGYAYVSYFLTGENRTYNRQGGYFDRVRPYTNFFRVRTCDGVQSGWGAWELAYRWSYSDFYSGLPTAEQNVNYGNPGRVRDNTIGLNWYWNPNMRLMFNYVFSDFDRVNAGSVLTHGMTENTFEMRASLDF